jgi:hypothetical protein
MKDHFSAHAAGLTSPAEHADPITPSDDAELPRATRALYVGQGGDVAVRFVSGEAVVLANLQGGTVYPLRLRQILASGTMASGLVGLS